MNCYYKLKLCVLITARRDLKKQSRFINDYIPLTLYETLAPLFASLKWINWLTLTIPDLFSFYDFSFNLRGFSTVTIFSPSNCPQLKKKSKKKKLEDIYIWLSYLWQVRKIVILKSRVDYNLLTIRLIR